MMKVKARNICSAIDGQWISGSKEALIKGLSCRSVGVKSGLLYFDVKGGQRGNEKILEALENGAVGIVLSKHKKILPFDNPNIVVMSAANVIDAFWSAVKYYRDLFDIPVVGVTGTSGKTTTKEMVSSIFRTRWKVLKTIGNQNLPFFVPTHIMMLTNGYKAAVFEIGMNRPGQVSKQSRIIQPKVGIITHIGTGHIEHLGTHENVIKEKAGIIDGIPDDGFLVLNADDPATSKINLTLFKGKVIYYSLENQSDYQANDVLYNDKGTTFSIMINQQKHEFFIPTFGRHNVYNATAAIAVARVFKIPLNNIKRGLANYRKPRMRLEIIKGVKDSVLINDTYNANPDSMIAGLEVLSMLAKNKTSIAVLGNMLEQGTFTRENHRQVGLKAVELGIDWLVTVGNFAWRIGNEAQKKSTSIKVWSFFNKGDAVKFLRQNIVKDSVILVKGSHGAHMERVVKGIEER